MKSKIISKTLTATLITIATTLSGANSAQAITFTGSQNNLEASADFTVLGDQLQVELTNISNNDVLRPTDVLTAVFFNLAGDPTLTPLSATLASGSQVLFGTENGGNLGGEFAYKTGFNVDGARQGISSVGLGLFGPKDRFDTNSNLQGPTSPNGLQYGITSAGDNPNTGNTPVTGTRALIQNSVVFNLSGLPSGFTEADISNVSFQYGTDLKEPRFPGEPSNTPNPGDIPTTPEPAMSLAFGLLSVGLGWYRTKRQSA